MNVYEKPMCGTLRIKNPKTLQRWITNGLFQKELNEGYVFNTKCGRFRIEKCKCTKCRNKKGINALDRVLIDNNLVSKEKRTKKEI